MGVVKLSGGFSRGCLEGVGRRLVGMGRLYGGCGGLSGGGVEVVWRVCGDCLVVVERLSGGYCEAIWRV